MPTPVARDKERTHSCDAKRCSSGVGSMDGKFCGTPVCSARMPGGGSSQPRSFQQVASDAEIANITKIVGQRRGVKFQ